MANGKALKVKNGEVSTPPVLADYVATKALMYLESSVANDQARLNGHRVRHSIKAIDPACGSGELLQAVWNSYFRQSQMRGPVRQDRAVDVLLCGVDNRTRSIKRATSVLKGLDDSRRVKLDFRLKMADSLAPSTGSDWRSGWSDLLRQFGAESGFDIAIANPPWGVELRRKTLGGEFDLLEGQADSSDLFAEIAISIVREGGIVALIIPDSLFQSDKTQLRRHLLEKTRVLYVGRMGEGIFPKVNRGCAVVIAQKGRASNSGGLVRCFRLASTQRRQIGKREITLAEAERISGHDVPLSRFVSNPDFLFDIDTRESDVSIIEKLVSGDTSFGDHLVSSRGVELSKRGIVRRCPTCEKWQPIPVHSGVPCSNCSAKFPPETSSIAKIIRAKPSPASKQLIVGEHVQRYLIKGHLYLELGLDGIKYKNHANYKGPKILVRKTGITISASIDYEDAYTNQVVYILKPRASAGHTVPLEIFLAILNSRAINYLFMKRHGEIEWKSHPYITQHQVSGITIPEGRLLDAATTYADVLNSLREGVAAQRPISAELDATVEGMVAFIYGLDREDYRRIFEFLLQIQQLQGVRKLNEITVEDVFQGR
ncbi:MAG: N-6 DNA methylase [Chloroflexi bacterium]|nr:N-6 DNA methylase [Chloroflexota bacterium]